MNRQAELMVIILAIILLFSSFFLPSLALDIGFPGENVSYVPGYLQIGDILFCDVHPTVLKQVEKSGLTYVFHQKGAYNDHCALYIGDNVFVEAIPYRMSSEGILYGVVKSHISWYQLWASNITYASVEATQAQRLDAVKWALTQLYQPYKTIRWSPAFLEDDEWNYSVGWYCSELIGEAYIRQGVTFTSSSSQSIRDLLAHVTFYKQQQTMPWYPGMLKDWSMNLLIDILTNKYQEPI